jgi:hypothetical protein
VLSFIGCLMSRSFVMLVNARGNEMVAMDSNCSCTNHAESK